MSQSIDSATIDWDASGRRCGSNRLSDFRGMGGFWGSRGQVATA